MDPAFGRDEVVTIRGPMAEFSVDPYVDLYARRTGGMSASEVRALVEQGEESRV